ncbi:LysE family translocator [Burkholderia sp. 22PA0106]|uniref:LysE family translocator n=1 Tax=Burkholderia sp. 22PA0106 TaxID=3237371 RepID=UPI0039C01391
MIQPLLFTLTVMTILAMPGPTNTLLATGGATLGLRRALPLALAEALGYGIAILAVGLLLKPVLTQWPQFARVLRVAVSAYLFYLAWTLFRSGRGDQAERIGHRPITPRRVFVATLLNPKALVFAINVIPFDSPRVAFYLLGFVAILAPLSIAWILLGAALGKAAAGTGRERWIARAGAAVLGSFGVLLMASALK